jgi:hypothetical protein
MQNTKREYKEIIDYRALDSKVLVVAVAQEPIDEWSAYIGAVPGKHHSQEYLDVKAEGSKLSQEIASVIFPDFSNKYSWRY